MNWFMPLEWSYPGIWLGYFVGSRWKDYRKESGKTRRGGERSRRTITVLGHDVLRLWWQELFRFRVFHEQDLSCPSATTSQRKSPAPLPNFDEDEQKPSRKNRAQGLQS